MNIGYRNRRLERDCQGDNPSRAWGSKIGDKVILRLVQLAAFESLADVPYERPHRRHQLSQNRKGQFSVDLTENWRLVFYPAGEYKLLEDGGIDLESVREIIIWEVVDLH